jgi:hypothetical protein
MRAVPFEIAKSFAKGLHRQVFCIDPVGDDFLDGPHQATLMPFYQNTVSALIAIYSEFNQAVVVFAPATGGVVWC